jgi:hypothetical protein
MQKQHIIVTIAYVNLFSRLHSALKDANSHYLYLKIMVGVP